jgi:hypothetical protein
MVLCRNGGIVRSSTPIKMAVSIPITKIDSHPYDQPSDETNPSGQRQKDHLNQTDDRSCNRYDWDQRGSKLTL